MVSNTCGPEGPPYGLPIMLADFFEKLCVLLFFGWHVFFWCHFRMITNLEYLSFLVPEYVVFGNIFCEIVK
jgi:hypothetical protein